LVVFRAVAARCWKAADSLQGTKPATSAALTAGAKLSHRQTAKIKAKIFRIEIVSFCNKTKSFM
jgi:hypothetical protein